MSKLWILVVLMILSGCSSLPDKDFKLEMASIAAEGKYYQGGDYVVYVEENRSSNANDNVSVDLHMLTKSMVEKSLLTTKTVVLTKNKEEADYFVESRLETASYGSKSTEKGIIHMVTTTGRVRVFELPSKNLVKDIPFNDNSRENSVNSKNRDTLYQEALYSSIGYGVFDHLLDFFSPKGIVIDGQKSSANLKLKAMLNGSLVSAGDDIDVFSIEKIDSELISGAKFNHQKICSGEVSDNSGSFIVWVVVDKDCRAKKGDYVAVSKSIGWFGKGVNLLGKGVNNAFRKNPIK